MTNTLHNEVTETLGPAWASVIFAMLGSAPPPDTWVVHELSTGQVVLYLGDPEDKTLSIAAGSVAQASVLQGMLTIAKHAVSIERDRALPN